MSSTDINLIAFVAKQEDPIFQEVSISGNTEVLFLILMGAPPPRQLSGKISLIVLVSASLDCNMNHFLVE